MRKSIRIFFLLCLGGGSWSARAQSVAPAGRGPAPGFYLGLEGIIFPGQPTRFGQSGPFVTAADRATAPAPALLLGYALSPRLGVEVGLQDLPVLTGYQYQRDSPSYLGFGQSYTHDYLYVPVRGLVRVLGPEHRLGLSVLAGGGPAFTESDEGALSTPYGTVVHYRDGSGSIGSGPTAPAGTTTEATVTLGLRQEKTTIGVFEAGLRGTWQVRPHLALDLTVRQLWSTVRSARTISLDLQAGPDHLTTTLTTPVQGVATGLSVRYLL